MRIAIAAISTLAALLLATAAFCAPAVQSADCSALYVDASHHELWAMSAGGDARLIVRDERGINAPRWSPSGRRIAYAHDFHDLVSELVVLDDASGQTVTTIPIAEERGFNAVLELGWRGESTIWTEGHTTPSSGIYYEWDVATGRASNEQWGSWFAPAPGEGGVAHLAHVPHGAPREYAGAKVMVDDRIVYPSKDDKRIHEISGGFAWSGRDLVFVDRVNGASSLVSVDTGRGTVAKMLPLAAGTAVEQIDVRDRRVVFRTSNGFFSADLAAGRVRELADPPRALRALRVDVEEHRFVDEAGGTPRKGTVVVEHLRCR
jgi:hypothetical protein